MDKPPQNIHKTSITMLVVKQRAKVTQAEFSTANGIDATAVEAELMNGVLGSSDESSSDENEEMNQVSSMYAVDDEAANEAMLSVFSPDVETSLTTSLKHDIALGTSAGTEQASRTLTDHSGPTYCSNHFQETRPIHS
jgi:hypothetical protein